MTSKDYLALYKPLEKFDPSWGVRVTDAGFTHIKPGEEYPPSHHPSPYLFTWGKGRRLDKYQIVFIGRGRGELETEHGGKRRIGPGDAFVLFPGEWHRYRPDPATGWTERWCGFVGSYASHVMEAFFSVSGPVVKGASSLKIRKRMKAIDSLYEKGDPSCVPSLVAETIGLLADLVPFVAVRECRYGAAIANVCDELVSKIGENLNLDDLARRNGMSYTLFRRIFKERTGCSPHEYVANIRFDRACQMLRNTTMAVEEIGDALGFSSLSYFSAAFKKRFGLYPRAWRTKE